LGVRLRHSQPSMLRLIRNAENENLSELCCGLANLELKAKLNKNVRLTAKRITLVSKRLVRKKDRKKGE